MAKKIVGKGSKRRGLGKSMPANPTPSFGAAGSQLTTNILQNGAANYTVDNADVLAIAVSRAENTCNAEIAKAGKVVTAMEKSERELADKTHKGIADEFVAAAVIAVQPMRSLMEGRGLKIDAVNTYQGKTAEGIIAGQAQLTGERREKRPNGPGNPLLDIVAEKLTYQLQVSVPQSQEVVKNEADLKALREELQKARAVLGHWRVQKSNIPSLERQVKANLAEARLRETDAGREILDNMANTLQTQLLAGPSIDV